MNIFLFQKGIIESAVTIALKNAKTISTKPNLSCSFNTKIYRVNDEKKPSNVYSIIENPILKNAFNKRKRIVMHMKSNTAFVAICTV